MLELADCMRWGVEKAKEVFTNCGYHENIIIGYTANTSKVIGLNYHDEIEKKVELSYVKSLFANEGIQMYIHIAEAWIVKLNKGETLSTTPSESSRRQEVLIVMGVSRTQKMVCQMDINRSGDKTWLGDGEIKDASTVEGIFASLLDEEPKEFS